MGRKLGQVKSRNTETRRRAVKWPGRLLDTRATAAFIAPSPMDLKQELAQPWAMDCS